MKRTSVLILSAIFVAGLAFAKDALSISGSVVDPSDQAVARAVVQLASAGGSAVLSAETDTKGHYYFDQLSAGDYLLSASAKGMSVTEPVRIHLDRQNESVILRLIVSAQVSQITVTAATTPQSIDLVSKALTVVNTDEAERRGVFTLGDAVAQVPGLRITTRGGPGSFTTIQTRGMRAPDTAVLIDGFRFRDITGIQGDASAFLSDLFLVDSSQVEVLRGSGSSLYGTNSMAGTINIITDQSGGPMHADLDLQGGGLGLGRGVARVSGGVLHNRVIYSGGISHLNETQGVNEGGAARNWSAQGGASVAISPALRLGGRIFADTNYLQLQVNPFPLGQSGATIIRGVPLSSSQFRLANAGQPYEPAGASFVQALNDPDARRNGRFVNAALYLDGQTGSRASWRLSYQSESTRRNNLDGPGGPGSFQPLIKSEGLYNGRIDTAQGRVNLIAAPWNLFTAGYEFENERYSNLNQEANPDAALAVSSFTTARQSSSAAFFQDQSQLLNGRLLVLLSGRFQRFQLDQPGFYGGSSPYAGVRLPSPPDAFTGDASAAYFIHKTSTKLRAHAGNSFRQPSLYERFGTYFFGGFFTPYGDPRLSPERAVSTDAGIDQSFWRERLRLSGTYFYTHLQQVIGFDSFGFITPENDPYGRFGGYYNTSGGVSNGVELSGEFRPTNRTFLQAAYTYTNARDRISQYSTGSGSNPIETPRILRHTVTLRAYHQLTKALELGADFVGGSDYQFPLYGLAYRFEGPRQLGLSANYTIPISERVSLRLYTRVYNALDQLYFEDGFQTPRRWAVGGVRISF